MLRFTASYLPLRKAMRTTIEMSDDLHECMRRQAQREGISLAKLLGRMVETAVTFSQSVSTTHQRSGRFTVIAGEPGAHTESQAVQKAIDYALGVDHVTGG